MVLVPMLQCLWALLILLCCGRIQRQPKTYQDVEACLDLSAKGSARPGRCYVEEIVW